MKLLWLQSGGCGGCTMSLLCSSARDLPGLLAGAGIELAWHPSLSEATGDAVRALLAEFESGRTALDLLCVEGSLLTGPAGSGRFHMLSGTGRAMIDWVRSLAARARYTLAVGTCAAYGGITAAGLNPAGAVGLQYDGEQRGGLLGADYRSAAGLPVINVAGCPTHPDWVTDTLIALALGRFAEADLDALGRPRFYADQLVHHGCTRNEFYEFKASAETPGDLGCMMEHLGCKGTQAHADCNIRPWNGLGSCTNGGYPCISCTEPGFESPGHPFGLTPKVAGIPIGLPSDMPKAWFVALAALSKSATPERVRRNSVVEAPVLAPATRRTRLK
ncbi:MAG TPA: HupU protein [Zoogloea sp.]|uniref:NADH-quinone oxidoreductase subunit B family protein n=1 Tax=Zoogloea sp. TaxID=49181 RepID=UPI002C5CD5C4|nr:HupU protein [Zoogloea sp.]HMV19245.1 HupU protein [Rhodocyclaceae bacterium]HMV64157.1 HupU protein [Rhodocyclaceae bacterium]HMW53437.1 HupU protein [Rhodocyclaceae bacterium]HMZ76854.1 HupU protein [Rhodocyclaceae bacterium]HNA69137.1 HupU protein [Rhodocyclaceae bacterium]